LLVIFFCRALLVEIEYSGEAPTLKGGPLGNNFTFSQIHFHWGAYGTADGSEHQIKDHE
jgi:Eukaryotic-type carbonic anhydrase